MEVRRGRGRPKLGVIGRKITLRPEDWEWLASKGDASAVIRDLIDKARASTGPSVQPAVSEESSLEASNPVFAAIWNNEEDAVYDRHQSSSGRS